MDTWLRCAIIVRNLRVAREIWEELYPAARGRASRKLLSWRRAEELAEAARHERPGEVARNADPRPDAAAQFHRRHADLPAEQSAKAAERTEPDVEANVGDGPAGDGEQLLGPVEAKPGEEFVRGFAEGG